MGWGRIFGRLVGSTAWALTLVGWALAGDEPDLGLSYRDTGRFYLYFETGLDFIANEKLPGDIEFDAPANLNVVLGGGGGYNISDHWGIELQAHGTEPDLRSRSRGKVDEYSNITIIPAVRFRWPVDAAGRIVPYVTAGVGGSLNDPNDTSDPSVSIDTDETTLAGSIAVGVDYFLAPNVAVGLSTHGFIYPDQDTTVVLKDVGRRDEGSLNFSSVSILAHMRVFPGQQAAADRERRFLLADEGPFDTDARRIYVYLTGGHTFLFDDDFGGGVEMAAPGDFNATLGGGIGVNLSRHWGAEIQLTNTDPNVNLRPFGKFGELSTFTVLPMARFRWPFLGGRLVPFARAGLGVAFFKLNDFREVVDIPTEEGTAVTARTPDVHVDDQALAGSIGVGVEYFLNSNLSVGCTLPAYLYSDLTTRVQQGNRPPVNGHVNFSGLAAMIELKAYLP